MIALLDNGQDLAECEAEIGCPVGQLLTPLGGSMSQPMHDPHLTVDRQFNQIRQRDKIIRQLWMLALILAAIILVLAMMLLIATKAQALECRSSPQSGTYWSWRQIDGRKCWYQGRHVLPKAQLHWRAPADNKPIITDEIKNHRAEASPVDANGGELTAYTEVMEKPQPPDDCCWPPLDERSFKSRWDEIPVGWR